MAMPIGRNPQPEHVKVKAIQAFLGTRSIADAAAVVSVTPAAVRCWLGARGIDWRTRPPRRSVTLSEADKQEIVDRVAAGETRSAIARSLGIGRSYVCAVATKAGLVGSPHADWSDADKAAALDFYRSGGAITEIRRSTGIPTTTMFRWILEAGIARPLSESMAARCASRPVGAEHLGIKGVFHSAKAGRWIATDSLYELARATQLETDSAVIWFDRCRRRIPYAIKGKCRVYVPDFEVRFLDGTVRIEEVKPEQFVRAALHGTTHPLARGLAEKIAAGIAHCTEVGASFLVVTEDVIGREFLATFKMGGLTRLANDEYQKERRSRNRLAENAYQRAYAREKRAKAAPEQLAAIKAAAAAAQRRYRARKRAKIPV